MGTTLLHFADLHLDAPFEWVTPDQARKRRSGLRATLVKICDLATELKVDAVTCGGDLYEHERFTPDTQAFLHLQNLKSHQEVLTQKAGILERYPWHSTLKADN